MHSGPGRCVSGESGPVAGLLFLALTDDHPGEFQRTTDLHAPEGTVWREVLKLLYRMGGVESWPSRVDFVLWLQNEVVPLLRFAVNGEPLPGEVEDAGDVDEEAKPEQTMRQVA